MYAQSEGGTIAYTDVAHYGTGATNFTAYGPITAGSTGTGALTSITPGSSGTVLTSHGSAAPPSYDVVLVTVSSPALAPNDSSISSSLALWLKADAGVYNDAGSTLATNGQTVRQWQDQSGNARHANQVTSAARPTYVTAVKNGLPILRFATQGMQVASLPTTSVSLIAIFRADSGGMICETGTSIVDGTGGLILYTQTSPSIGVTKGSTNAWRDSRHGNNWCNQHGWGIFGLHYTGDNSQQLVIEQGQLDTGTFSGAVTTPGVGSVTNTFNIMARNNNGSLNTNGDLAEIVVFSPAITTMQLRAVILWEQAKWGL